MDTPLGSRLGTEISLLSWSLCERPEQCLPYLKSRKMLKFMGKQDQLAVAAAAVACQQAALSPEQLQGAGLYLVVGQIPFQESDILPLAQNSSQQGQFSMQRFSSSGLDQVNPLLTFRCLPNMPAFHVAYSLGIQGPSFTTYPGLGQFYQALEQALWALSEEQISIALVGAVADQDNFLVDFQRRRLGHPGPPWDSAGFLCLSRGAAGRGRLEEFELSYPHHAGEEGAGPVDLFGCLAQGQTNHARVSHDGLSCLSRWSLP